MKTIIIGHFNSSRAAYDIDAQAYFDQVITNGGTPLSTSWKNKLNSWFIADKASGNFSKRICLYFLFNESEIAAKINVVNPSSGGWTYPINEGVFRTFNGIRIGKDGNGSPNSSYIKTGFIPSTMGGSLYTTSSGHEGFGITDNVDGAFVDMGGTDGTQSDYVFSAFGGNAYSKMSSTNAGNGLTIATGVPLDGNYHVTRTDISTLNFYKGNTASSGTDVAVGLMTEESYLGGFRTSTGSFSLLKIANYTWFGYGGGLINVALSNANINTLFGGFKQAIIYGNSIAQGHIGTSAHSSLCWTTLYCAAKGLTEKNRAVGGTSLESATPVDPEGASPNMYDNRTDIPTYSALEHEVLIIDYCVNDCGFNFVGYNTTNYETQSSTILDEAIITKGWPPSKIIFAAGTYINDPVGWNTYTILGCPAPDNTRFLSFRTSTQTVATLKGTLCGTPYNYMSSNGGNSLLSDGVHPNVSGHAVIAAYYIANF